MKRRSLILGLAATLALTAGAALAETYAEDVVRQLTRLGFSNITVETTLLGRIKIQATRDDGIREIVLNPRTGEILRDVWFPTGTGGEVRRVLNDIEDDDDRDGDDRDDDDGDRDDDDNSGPGSGGDDGDDDNSGSGSGGDDDDRDDDDRDEKRDD